MELNTLKQRAFYAEYSTFESELNAGSIPDNVVCYIADTKQIYAKNTLFTCKDWTDRVTELESTVESQAEEIAALQEVVDMLMTGANYYVACYEKGSTDYVPLFSQGNDAILKQFNFYLLDTTDNSGETTTPVGQLQKNNLFHFVNGGYAPTVGITEDMYNECMSNDIYTSDDGSTYDLLYSSGDFDAESQWETDKALIQEGSEATKLYKLVSGSYTEVEHVLRPWETTETKYTIGLAHTQDLYILDNVVGDSGRYWKGIFTAATVWDGIDLAPYKLARTAMGPGPMTTIVDEDGLTKCRNFFYAYKASSSYCQSNSGYITSKNGATNPFYRSDRHYPRTTDVQQVTNMDYARNNNSDTSISYPFAEGGWWTFNAYIIAQELLAATRYIFNQELFGSGISSNNGCSSSTFYTNGGVKITIDSTDYYYSMGTTPTEYRTSSNDGFNCSQWLAALYPLEACMESQMAASMASELGIAPTEDPATSMNSFEFYGDTYYYMDVPGFDGLQDGDMNTKVYKYLPASTVEGYDTEGNSITTEWTIILRMSLYGGANLSGDIWNYNGGGLEMVGTRETDDTLGLPVSVYLQPDQKLWHHDSVATKKIGETWDFEDFYIKVGDFTTLYDGSYTLERMSNSPARISRSSSFIAGECYYFNDYCYWASVGYRARIRVLSRGRAFYSDCSPRALHAAYYVLNSAQSDGGSFQALIS